MQLIRKLTASLLLMALPLAHAQIPQTVTLSGSTEDLQWSVYSPGELTDLEGNLYTLRLSAHPDGTVLGVKYEGENILLTERANRTLQAVFAYHDQQLRLQGFTRTAHFLGDQEAEGVYTRDNDTIELNILKDPEDVYRLTFNLDDVKAGTLLSNGNVPNPVLVTPLFGYDLNGVHYDFFGPDGPTTGFTPDLKMVRLVVPTGALDVQKPMLQGDESVFTRFEGPWTIREVFEKYHQQLLQQGYGQYDGWVEEGTHIVSKYRRGGDTLRLDVWTKGGAAGRTNFEILVDFTP